MVNHIHTTHIFRLPRQMHEPAVATSHGSTPKHDREKPRSSTHALHSNGIDDASVDMVLTLSDCAGRAMLAPWKVLIWEACIDVAIPPALKDVRVSAITVGANTLGCGDKVRDTNPSHQGPFQPSVNPV